MGTEKVPSTTAAPSSSSSSLDVATVAVVGVGIGMVAGTMLTRLYYLQKTKRSMLASRPAYKPGQKPTLPCPEFGSKIRTFDPTELTSAYQLMISTATPRPIALVGSRHPTTKVDNVAPFSYFGALGHDPPMVAVGFCRNRNGQMKDSITNIMASKEFSIQIISEWYLDAANHSCGAFSPDTDEFDESGMTKVDCSVIAAPRVKEAGVVYECQLVHVHPITNPTTDKPTTEIALARVVRVHVDETILVTDIDPMKPAIDTSKLKPLGRLGGNLYTALGEIIDIPRPKVS